ncbi:MAG: AMP-binding protein [Rhodobacteraceae bacterium]|nr:AMP-binding protein [Paracoccaceae bacterium]
MPNQPAADERTIPQLLARNARNFGDQVAYREKEFGIWQSWTWKEVAEEVEALALGLIELGIEEGDHVAIAGRNRPHLYWSFVAVQSVGGIPVPIYQEAVGEEIGYVLKHCEANYLIAGDQEQVDKVLEEQSVAALLRHVLYLDPRGLRKYDSSRLHAFKDIQAKGREVKTRRSGELERRRSALDGQTPCVMLYTSGTTGNPKGVVLTHHNIIWASRQSCAFDSLTNKESVLAYLPMAWVGDFIFSIGQGYWTGFCVNCPESSDTMLTDLREIGPTYFFAPPRVFEALLTNVMIRMEDAGRIKKRMFHHFMNHARKVGVDILSKRRVPVADRIKYTMGEWLVYGPLRNVLGMSKVRIGYTAGEAIGPEIFDFYRSLGVNLKQLYGQTEASVFITLQPDGEVFAETVGIPGPGVEMRIDEAGEIHYRSDGTFREYYKNPEATASTRDSEGWVATGDAGYFDQATGHLKIIDRAKDVGKTAAGALFAPKYVENRLKFHSDILEVVLFGNQREFCTAIVNIDLEAVSNWAERNSVTYGSYQELAGHPSVCERIRGFIEETNRAIAEDPQLAGCQVHRFLVLHKELDADDGELTRTKKVRRNIVEDKYHDLVTALYSDNKSIETSTEVTYEDGRKGTIRANIPIHDAKVHTAAHNGSGGPRP